MAFTQTDDEGLKIVKTIQRCTHCGEETTKGRKFCKFCDSATKRAEVNKQNEAIKQENLKLGFKYANI
jgi:rRNA maturation endonuclease Nob1